MNNIQNTIELAYKIFDYQLPPQNYIPDLKEQLQMIRPEELQLEAKMSRLDFSVGWEAEAIHKSDDFSFDLFMIPQGETMPLHDHPSMWVVMKVLWGKMRITSYDWAHEYPWSGLARQRYSMVLDGGSNALTLEPKNGNLHQITALENCAFIDFIFPPYCEVKGRSCHYYRVAGQKEVNGELLNKLEVASRDD